MEKTPLDRVFEILGGPSAVARHFIDPKTGKPIRAWAVSKWRQRVPPERVLRLEALTGGKVTRYELRPDVYGEAPIRHQAESLSCSP